MKLGQQAMEALKSQIDGALEIGDDLVVAGVIAIEGTQILIEKEKEKLLDMLTQTTGGKGMMHEGFCKDDPTRYTREWFSWANAMYAELFLDYFGYRLRV